MSLKSLPLPFFLALLSLTLLAACGGGGGGATPTPTPAPTPTATPTPTPILVEPTEEIEPPMVPAEVVVSKANFPANLAFAPDGRLFYTENCFFDVRIITPDDRLLPRPFAHVDAAGCQDWGLTGLALDPDFESNGYVYVHYMELVSADPMVAKPVVMRFTDVGNVGTDPTIILDDTPLTDPAEEPRHAAGNIHFGPDGYLYISIGDMQIGTMTDLSDVTNAAQDLSTLKGKILRVNKSDGSAAPDNPFVDDPEADPRIFAYGLRNSYDFTFHGKTGQLYATENGPDRCDELNIIEAGKNYGWPVLYEPDSCDVPIGVQPIYWFTFHEGASPWNHNGTASPVGIEYIDGDIFPSLGDSMLACQFRNGKMIHLKLGGEAQDEVVNFFGFGEIIRPECGLDIAISPLGVIYYSNTNTILRLVLD